MATASDRRAESYSIFVFLNSMPGQCTHSAPEKHASFREEFLMFFSSLAQHAISSLLSGSKILQLHIFHTFDVAEKKWLVRSSKI